MYITVANYKGGVGKTTTAIHVAAYLHGKAPTLLIDSDPNQSAIAWARMGKLPFPVMERSEGLMKARDFEHVIVDTEARPGHTDFQSLAKGCNLLIIPTAPAGMETNSLGMTISALKEIGSSTYRVLLTMVPPAPQMEGTRLRADLEKRGVPLFKAEIPTLKAYKKAFLEGVPVYDVDDRIAARAWAAYEAIGKEILL